MSLPESLLPEFYFWAFLTLWTASLVLFGTIALLVKTIGFSNRPRWLFLFFVLSLGISIWAIVIALPRYQLEAGLWIHAPQHGMSTSYLSRLERTYTADIHVCQIAFFLVLACLLMLWLLEIFTFLHAIKAYKRTDTGEQLYNSERDAQQHPLNNNTHRRRWLSLISLLGGFGFLTVGIVIASSMFLPLTNGNFLPIIHYGSAIDPTLANELILLESVSLFLATIGGPLLFLLLGMMGYLEIRQARRHITGSQDRQRERGGTYRHVLWRNIAALLLLIASLTAFLLARNIPTLISNVSGYMPALISDRLFDSVVFSMSLVIGGLLWLFLAVLLFQRPNQKNTR